MSADSARNSAGFPDGSWWCRHCRDFADHLSHGHPGKEPAGDELRERVVRTIAGGPRPRTSTPMGDAAWAHAERVTDEVLELLVDRPGETTVVDDLAAARTAMHAAISRALLAGETRDAIAEELGVRPRTLSSMIWSWDTGR